MYEITFFQLGGESPWPEHYHDYTEALRAARDARNSYAAAHPGRGLRLRSMKDKYQVVRKDGIVEFQARITRTP